MIVLCAILLVLLSACDGGKNLADICAENPEVCAQFKEDSWCKTERNATTYAAVELKNKNEEINKYNLLVAYESYAKCVEFSAKIEHVKLKGKRTIRIENYLKAKDLIEKLSDETVTSNHPNLLYFHWSRYLNEASLIKFINMEGSAPLETPEAQYNLATYYIKRDKEKTLSLLFHALELVKEEESINVEIFETISTIFSDKNKPDQAYIWLKVIRLYQPDNIGVKEESLLAYSETYELNSKFLDKVALNTLNKIKSGNFTAPN